MKSNKIRHLTLFPNYLRTNNLAVRFLQTFRVLRRQKNDERSKQKKLCNFRIEYRSTLISSTCETPAQLFLGRNLTTKVD